MGSIYRDIKQFRKLLKETISSKRISSPFLKNIVSDSKQAIETFQVYMRGWDKNEYQANKIILILKKARNICIDILEILRDQFGIEIPTDFKYRSDLRSQDNFFTSQYRSEEMMQLFAEITVMKNACFKLLNSFDRIKPRQQQIIKQKFKEMNDTLMKVSGLFPRKIGPWFGKRKKGVYKTPTPPDKAIYKTFIPQRSDEEIDLSEPFEVPKMSQQAMEKDKENRKKLSERYLAKKEEAKLSEQEKAERVRAKREEEKRKRAEEKERLRERIEKERAEILAKKQEKEKAERERAEREKARREKAKKERAIEKERKLRERIEKERAEILAKKQERERIEKERVKRERAEREAKKAKKGHE